MTMKNQLLYMWIKETDYHCFNNSEFNFSPEFEFSFSEQDKRLSVKKTNKINVYSSNLYNKESNVCNVTALVGNNGAGKTTALKKIVEMWKLKYYERTKRQGDCRGDSIYIVIKNSVLTIINNTALTDICFSTNFYELFPKYNIINLNKEKAIYRYLKIDSTVVYISLERKDTISFGGLMSSNFIPLTPKQIENVRTVFIRNKSPNFMKTPVRYGYFNFENFLFGFLFSKYENILLSKNKLHFGLTLTNKNVPGYAGSITKIDSYYRYYLEITSEDNVETALIKKLVNELLSLVDIDMRQKLSDDVSSIISNNNKWSEYNIIQIKRSFSESVRGYDDVGLYIDIAFSEIREAQQILLGYTVDELIYGIDILDVEKLSRLYDLILNKEKKYSFLFKYINISIDGSDGELAYLRHLAYLVFASNPKINPYHKEKHISDNVLILLDEADIHLHPEWQRQLLSNIINSINSIFNEKNVQIILTTHSPIVLSDIPTQNIIYIDNKNHDHKVFKDYCKNTFGANIYDLYNDSFFFDSSIIMGDYAKNYIDNLYDAVAKLGINSFEKNIELIGDENIKNAFYNMFNKNERIKKNDDINEQMIMIKNNIEYLNEKLKELEKSVHDKD